VVFSTFSLEGLPARSLASPEIRPNGEVTFRFRGQPGRFVSLIGEFNRWDPFWEPMPEDPARPGLYQVTLRLPPGPHYYVFSVDGERVPDPLNVEMAEDAEGFRVSTFRLPPRTAVAPAR
jgi:1,4-alpha-glucan branching enzyme